MSGIQAGTTRQELRTILELAWPVVLGQCGFTAMSIEEISSKVLQTMGLERRLF